MFVNMSSDGEDEAMITEHDRRKGHRLNTHKQM